MIDHEVAIKKLTKTRRKLAEHLKASEEEIFSLVGDLVELREEAALAEEGYDFPESDGDTAEDIDAEIKRRSPKVRAIQLALAKLDEALDLIRLAA